MSVPLVSVRDLTVAFTGNGRAVHAVNGVDFDLAPGEVLGVIGESGSGKSVTPRALLRILPPKRTKISGTIRVDGRDALALSGRELDDYRGGAVSMIFQEPMLAFDPVFSIGDQIAESVMRHRGVGKAAARAPWKCWNGSRFRTPGAGWTRTPTRCPAACASEQ